MPEAARPTTEDALDFGEHELREAWAVEGVTVNTNPDLGDGSEVSYDASLAPVGRKGIARIVDDLLAVQP